VDTLVPEYNPWWRYTYEPPKITEVDAPTSKEEKKIKERCPEVWSDIPDFVSIMKGEPSELIKYAVLNVLYAYAYAVRFHYGDYSGCEVEFVDMCERLSGALNRGENFDLADTAVEAAASAVNLQPDLAISLEFSRSVKKDVHQIVKGPSPNHPHLYILASLSELRSLYLAAAKQMKEKKSKMQQPTKFSRTLPDLNAKTLKLRAKKVEFYLCWAAKYHSLYSSL